MASSILRAHALAKLERVNPPSPAESWCSCTTRGAGRRQKAGRGDEPKSRYLHSIIRISEGVHWQYQGAHAVVLGRERMSVIRFGLGFESVSTRTEAKVR